MTKEEQIKKLMEEVIEGQRLKVLRSGRTFLPQLTTDDVLQPNDYPELEANPLFRYEEGALEGMHTMRSAILAFFKESYSRFNSK